MPDLLRSVAAQTVAPAETILVDNASTDGGLELVRREFPWVRIVPLTRNDGPGPARNRGLEEARTRLVFALDSDVVLGATCLERCLAAFAADRGLAVAEPRAVDAASPEFVQYDGAHFHYVGLLTLRNFYKPLTEAAGHGAVPIDAFVSVAILCDRAKLLEAGGYDPRYFILFEDSDLAYRLRVRGERMVAVEDALVLHRGGTAGTSFRGGAYPGRRVFLHARNRWLFLVKNYEAGTLLLGAPGLLLYEGAAFLFAIGRGAFLDYVKGKLGFLALLGGALRDRRALRGARVVRDRTFVRGGPLTLWPPLTQGRAGAAAGRMLDGALAAWWRLTGGRA